MELREIRPVLYHGWGKKWKELDDFICLSIVPPKGMIDRTKEAQVALGICPSIIGYSQSYFSPINSAKENIAIDEILSLDSANAFESLFQYEDGMKLRNDYTEILVKDYIPVSDIRTIYYANWDGNGKILFPCWVRGMIGFSPRVIKSRRLF